MKKISSTNVQKLFIAHLANDLILCAIGEIMPFDQELLEKREKFLSQGINPYPYSFKTSMTLSQLREKSDELMEKELAVAGRITALRRQGKKVFFVDVEDINGRIQVYLKNQDIDEKVWESILLADIGDWVGINGKLFITKTAELTIWADNFVMLSKAVIRVPISKEKGDKKFYQLSDVETLYRQKYLHWITNKKARQAIITRSKIISCIRTFMEERDFLEVTTPTLELVYGGASARPFSTNVHALSNEEAYLRISPELPLKKFIVGGFPKVYTICQNFRNEGIDHSHNPEFTMMEWYEAFTDYHYQMEQFEQLVSTVVKKITGSYIIDYQGTELDFSTPWKRITIIDALKEIDIDVENMSDDELVAKLKQVDAEYKAPNKISRGHVINELFENLCEESLIQPTFVMDHPLAISPLTKKKRGNENLVERFEPFVMKMEIGNAYSELTDPVEQYDRLKAQREFDAESIKKDGVAHHPVDLDFIKALGMGMPPTGGVGLGVDRLVMLIANEVNIRDIIAFPLMKRTE